MSANQKGRVELMSEIRSTLSESAILEQMAEECSELTQALLKKARKLRNENYTPRSMEEINYSIREEFTDVIICAKILNIYENPYIFKEKLNRWVQRLTEDHDE